jgi:hypothetical protein
MRDGGSRQRAFPQAVPKAAVGSGVSALEQAGGAGRAGNAAKGSPALVSAGFSLAGGAVDPQNERANQVREWLFLLLRFAITWEPDDELAVIMMANGIDSLGRQWGRAAPTFFRRSSDQVCKAITALDDPRREAILKEHIRRIEQPGLRRAFQAAVHSEERAQQFPERSREPGLWTGLRGLCGATDDDD